MAEGEQKIYLVKWGDVTGKKVSLFLTLKEAVGFSLEKRSVVVTKYISDPFLRDIGGMTGMN